MRLSAILPQLRANGVTFYRETDAKGRTFELHLGPAPEKAAPKAEKEPPAEEQVEKFPKDAAALALKLVGNR